MIQSSNYHCQLIDGDIIQYRVGFRHEKTKKFSAVEADLNYYFKNSFYYPLKTNEYILFLTGKLNYRFDINEEYKGNRKGMIKPKWFNEIGELLLNKYSAIRVDGLEADDALGIVSTHFQNINLVPIICSLDKDLKQIPGYHFDFVNQKIFHIDTLEAKKHLWSQTLTGDMTDNIVGLKGIGPIKADKILGDDNWMIKCINKYLEVYNNDEEKALESLYKVYSQVKILTCEDKQPLEEWLKLSTFNF